MIVLDTNVVSELMRETQNEKVVKWVGLYKSSQLFITAVTQAEIIYGINLLPNGKRRAAFLAKASIMFTDKFRGRILSFDEHAAQSYADIAAKKRMQGAVISLFDAQIAAISLTNGFILSTRNSKDFSVEGLTVVNPWNG